MRAPAGRWWEARDARAATRVVAVMTMLGALYSVSLAFLAPATVGQRPGAFDANLVTAGVMFVLATPALLRPDRMPRVTPLVLALLAGAVVAWLDFITEDLSFGAQVSLVWPALFGAYYLRRPAAWLVAAEAVLSAVTLPLLLGEATTYLSDLPAFLLTVIAVTAALTSGRDRAELLLHRLRSEAEEDALTGLATRRVFDARLAQHLGQGRPCTLLLADVDQFKGVNDTHGHQVGDAVLQAVAARLDDVRRPGDVVARLGGDELALLLLDPDAGDRAGAAAAGQRLAERSREAVAATSITSDAGEVVRPTVSVGLATVAAVPAGGATLAPRDLLVRADRALYDAKRAGRDRVVAHREVGGVPSRRRGSRNPASSAR